MRRLVRYFLSGLLFLIPVLATIYIVYWMFAGVDAAVRKLLGNQSWWFAGLGVLISLATIFLVGILTSLFITRPVMQLIEKTFARLPLIKLLYSSIKDLTGAFVGEKKKFNRPVLVTLMRGSDIKALGFVTRGSREVLGLDGQVAGYLPQSYNFAGSVLIVAADQVTPIDADSSEVMAFIVSGGISGEFHHPKTVEGK